jgi:starch phosphorylase
MMNDHALRNFLTTPRVAYFSMEIALSSDIPTYAGGLGVLAGDVMRSAADLELPMVAVSLVSRHGYFSQAIDRSGRQVEGPADWRPEDSTQPLDAKIAITLEGRNVWIRGWLYMVEGHVGASVPVILLDTDLAENADEDRRLTDSLYGGSDAYRLKQEAVLGIGGVRMLAALGFQVWQFHMNEGHSALLGLELLHRHAWPESDIRAGEGRYDVQAVRALCNFTTHTPVEAGHDQFDYGLVAHILGNYIEMPVLRRLGGAERLNLTQLAMNLSEVVNGVTERHAEVSRGMFPGYRVLAITNGVHPLTWTCASFRALYNRYLSHWCHEPEMLVRAELFPDDEVWQAHRAAKQALIERVKVAAGRSLDPERPIIGFARRMTAYKRPDLLFTDLDRLRAIARRFPFQIVMAGKAHPHDEGGKHLIEALHRYARELGDTVPVAFLPGYDMDLALAMVSGADVWLNTPQPPLEASGTSGMKAAFNGVPNLSVLDGWWIEGCIEGVTGWAIGDGATGGHLDDSALLYGKLEDKVLPLYHSDRAGWIRVMKGAIGKNAYYFNSHRMMRRYATEAYLR